MSSEPHAQDRFQPLNHEIKYCPPCDLVCARDDLVDDRSGWANPFNGLRVPKIVQPPHGPERAVNAKTKNRVQLEPKRIQNRIKSGCAV